MKTLSLQEMMEILGGVNKTELVKSEGEEQ
jgi:hypothetical protein